MAHVHVAVLCFRSPRLVQFIEDLTNWYVRLNRKRLSGKEGDAGKHNPVLLKSLL
jgi:isoleucyl-tRNA synthetase